MAGLTCPNCNAVASTSEIASGWCDSCGKRIPSSYAAAATAPRRAARDALLASTTAKPARTRKPIVGTLIGMLLGVLVYGMLMIGPLHRTGYILMVGVGFAILLAAISLGQIVDGMFVKERK
jgi:hypothetical protein